MMLMSPWSTLDSVLVAGLVVLFAWTAAEGWWAWEADRTARRWLALAVISAVLCVGYLAILTGAIPHRDGLLVVRALSQPWVLIAGVLPARGARHAYEALARANRRADEIMGPQ